MRSCICVHALQTLRPKQVDRIRSVAQLRSVQVGEVLYEPSQPNVPLFIVLEGTVSTSRTGEDDKILAVREADQFTGEMPVLPESDRCSKRAPPRTAVFWNSPVTRCFPDCEGRRAAGDLHGGPRGPASVDDPARRGKCCPLRDEKFRARVQGIPYAKCTPIYLCGHRFRLLCQRIDDKLAVRNNEIPVVLQQTPLCLAKPIDRQSCVFTGCRKSTTNHVLLGIRHRSKAPLGTVN
jgi:hypothetical protein